MSTAPAEKNKSQDRLVHRTIDFYATPHRVLRALKAMETSPGRFTLFRDGEDIEARRNSQIWTTSSGATGRGSIALIVHFLNCSDADAAEWLLKFALMRWPFLERREFTRARHDRHRA